MLKGFFYGRKSSLLVLSDIKKDLRRRRGFCISIGNQRSPESRAIREISSFHFHITLKLKKVKLVWAFGHEKRPTPKARLLYFHRVTENSPEQSEGENLVNTTSDFQRIKALRRRRGFCVSIGNQRNLSAPLFSFFHFCLDTKTKQKNQD